MSGLVAEELDVTLSLRGRIVNLRERTAIASSLALFLVETLYSAREHRASSSEYLRAIVSEVRRRALTAAATQGFWRFVRSTNGREGFTLDICNPSLTRKRIRVLMGSSTFEPLARKAL